MRVLFTYIILLILSPVLIGQNVVQNIKQDLLKLNERYTTIESYSALTKVSYLDTANQVTEEQKGKYVQHDGNSLYVLGYYEVLSFGSELLQLNHTDSTAVYLNNGTKDEEKKDPMEDYLKKVSNYLKICKDSSITVVGDLKTVNIELKHPVDNVLGLKLTFSKDLILRKFEIKLSNLEVVRFEYFNVSFNKNKISKIFNRNDYLKGSGDDIRLNQTYANYKFNNFSNQ
jgi:outer membrane lipoprotein-sorting protein